MYMCQTARHVLRHLEPQRPVHFDRLVEQHLVELAAVDKFGDEQQRIALFRDAEQLDDVRVIALAQQRDFAADEHELFVVFDHDRLDGHRAATKFAFVHFAVRALANLLLLLDLGHVDVKLLVRLGSATRHVGRRRRRRHLHGVERLAHRLERRRNLLQAVGRQLVGLHARANAVELAQNLPHRDRNRVLEAHQLLLRRAVLARRQLGRLGPLRRRRVRGERALDVGHRLAERHLGLEFLRSTCVCESLRSSSREARAARHAAPETSQWR